MGCNPTILGNDIGSGAETPGAARLRARTRLSDHAIGAQLCHLLDAVAQLRQHLLRVFAQQR